MSTEFLMGNEAIALGALDAGVNVVTGYPGTPSSEILETVARRREKENPDVYVEWSVNEKAALEVAAGAAYAGARVLVTMKQVGLNVASDPLMSLAYVGVKGGMVIVSADDPGPISSQTEQDTRTFAAFAHLPVFDPSSPEEAYRMIGDAFALSEQYGTPVLFRPTTRVCHGCAPVERTDNPLRNTPEGFVRDPARWVIFPRASYLNHIKLANRERELDEKFSAYPLNTAENTADGRRAIACGGISYAYVKEALDQLGAKDVPLLRIATPYPFPEQLAADFLRDKDEILVAEELDPVIERALLLCCGRAHLPVNIRGKLDGTMPQAGENSVEQLRAAIAAFLGLALPEEEKRAEPPALPVRPPVLCAGCPHRASFYAVKRAMKELKKKSYFCGDIGCYTLGNAAPLDMVDTCLCMGADVTIAQGLRRVEGDAVCFSFIGDSTFFASGMTGVANAVYNGTDIVLAVLDNSTTAMTGHQPHPGTGRTMMGEVTAKLSIERVLEALGVSSLRIVDPLDQAAAVDAVKAAAGERGVRALIFRSPCIAVTKPTATYTVTDACIGCGKCVRELGCPATVRQGKKVHIDPALCFGCSLCAQYCPTGAIVKEEVR